MIDVAVDIGGGAFGGALHYIRESSRQAILVDALAPEFRAMGKLPPHIDSITADFDDIPLKDEIADVLFAWNVFDHATSNEHFILGMLEAKRLLKPGGLFFGSFPLRTKPSNGHPVTLTEELVMRQLNHKQPRQPCHISSGQRPNEFKILKTFKVHEPHYRDETLFVVAEKMLRLPS
jgi:SAM-dependent methyltransferase